MAWLGPRLDLSHRRGIRTAHSLGTSAPPGYRCSSGGAPWFAGDCGAHGSRCSLARSSAAYALEPGVDNLLAPGILLSGPPLRPAGRVGALDYRHSLPAAGGYLAAPAGAHGRRACLDRNDAASQKSNEGENECAIWDKHESGSEMAAHRFPSCTLG